MTLSAATKQDTILGRVIVDQGLCTRQEVEAAVGEQVEAGKRENQKSLGEILVERGYLTPGQLQRARSAVEETASSVQQIPGYQILSKLGSGAMATVFKARQVSLDRTVAIKVLPKRMSSNPEFVDRFYKEGKAAAKLNHPNIVAAFDVGEAAGYHYFVMEYVEGETVFDKLEDGTPYAEKDAIDMVRQVCAALVHAHAAGFIHRDVKPKNIMITPAGIAKLADMGLAREASDLAAAQAEAGKAYGTPYYISPEQIRGELDIDFRADIYSLGATFYHMVTGRVPFDAPSPSAVMHKHLKEELVPPDHINSQVSSGVGEIIETAMAKKRRNRYQSTQDMLTDLERVARGEPPILARTSYNLDSLAGLESSGSVDEPGTGAARGSKGGEVVRQDTIDFGKRTLHDRLMDPIVISLSAALVVCIIVLLILLMR